MLDSWRCVPTKWRIAIFLQSRRDEGKPCENSPASHLRHPLGYSLSIAPLQGLSVCGVRPISRKRAHLHVWWQIPARHQSLLLWARLPGMVQLRSHFQRLEIWPVFKSMVTARRNVGQSGNHCSADRQVGSRHTEAWTRSGGKPNCGKAAFCSSASISTSHQVRRFRNPSCGHVCKSLILRGCESGRGLFRNQLFLGQARVVSSPGAHC